MLIPPSSVEIFRGAAVSIRTGPLPAELSPATWAVRFSLAAAAGETPFLVVDSTATPAAFTFDAGERRWAVTLTADETDVAPTEAGAAYRYDVERLDGDDAPVVVCWGPLQVREKVGTGGGSVAPLPSRLGAILCFRPRPLALLSRDAAGTTPVTAPTQTVRRWADISGRNNHLTAPDTAPVYTETPAAGVLYNAVGSDHLELASPVALTGPCTVLAWGNRAAGPASWQPIRGISAATFALHPGGNVFAVLDDGTDVFAPYTGVGRRLFAWWRDAADHWLFQATDFAAVDLGALPGTLTLTRQFGVVGGTVEGLLVADADLDAAGLLPAAVRWIRANGGPGL